jgi:hypothetical protein
MNDQSIEGRIRIKAYELWLADGALEGCADEYWRQARDTVEHEIASELADDQPGCGSPPPPDREGVGCI